MHRSLGGSRTPAIAVTYLALVVLVAGVIVIAVPRLLDEGRRAATALPALVQQVSGGEIAWRLGNQHGWSYSTRAELERLIAGHRDMLSGWVQNAAVRGADISANAGWLILIP